MTDHTIWELAILASIVVLAAAGITDAQGGIAREHPLMWPQIAMAPGCGTVHENGTVLAFIDINGVVLEVIEQHGETPAMLTHWRRNALLGMCPAPTQVETNS